MERMENSEARSQRRLAPKLAILRDIAPNGRTVQNDRNRGGLQRFNL